MFIAFEYKYLIVCLSFFMLSPQGQIRKIRKVRVSGKALSCNQIAFGAYALKALETCRLTAKQIESSRKVLARGTKKTGRIWIRQFPHFPVTEKPADVRMGNGKGGIEYYVAKIKEGTILFEIDGVSEVVAKELFQKVSYKLPVKVTFIKRRFMKPIQ